MSSALRLIALMVAPVATEVAGGILLQSGRAVQTTSSVLCRHNGEPLLFLYEPALIGALHALSDDHRHAHGPD